MTFHDKIDRFKRVGSAIANSLILGTYEGWCQACAILGALLQPQERATLAFFALKSLPEEHAAKVVSAAFCNGAGLPQAPLFDFIDPAAFWADMADPEEQDAYAVAIFNAMPAAKKRAFLDFAGRAAA